MTGTFMLQTSKIEYTDGETAFEGYCAVDTSHKGLRPGVIVAHDWSGRNEFACQKAEQLAEMGYVGFALDMYGNGYVAKSETEKYPLMTPLLNDRPLLLKRVLAAFNTLMQMELVDTTRVGGMGYCFGGLCMLDLARSGAEMHGALSFHGNLKPPGYPLKKILAKILVLHGHDDPHVTPEHVANFEKEMTEAKVDWQVHVFGNTQHAFTNPKANDPATGFVYSPLADKRSWIMTKEFFHEIFSE
jgi:dienelactone hydrolase